MNPDPNMMMQQQMGPPPQPHVPYYIQTNMGFPFVAENFLNPYECDKLIEIFEDNPELHEAGRTGGAELKQDPKVANNPNVRSVDVINLFYSMGKFEETQMHFVGEITQKIIQAVESINQTTFRFDIDESQQMELARYVPGGKYDAHTDSGGVESARMRKLSFSITLNDPEEYDGGEIDFFGNSVGVNEEDYKNGNTKVKMPKGSLVIFPSFNLHQVHPVKENSAPRYSLFGWFMGPRFK